MNDKLPKQPGNPLPGVLSVLPYTDSILDVNLLDSIALKVAAVTNQYPTCGVLLAMLMELDTAGYVSLVRYEYPSTLGELYLIKRIR